MQYTIDAKGKKIGRLASETAKILLGKNDTDFRRDLEAGNLIHIINSSELYIDPKKMAEKTYSSYSGYPGGLKKKSLEKVLEKKGVAEVLRLAIYGMLPANKLRSRLMKNIKIS